jgi:hypothetical protein
MPASSPSCEDSYGKLARYMSDVLAGHSCWVDFYKILDQSHFVHF